MFHYMKYSEIYCVSLSCSSLNLVMVESFRKKPYTSDESLSAVSQQIVVTKGASGDACGDPRSNHHAQSNAI